jgi:hypothetical protein
MMTSSESAMRSEQRSTATRPGPAFLFDLDGTLVDSVSSIPFNPLTNSVAGFVRFFGMVQKWLWSGHTFS